MVFARRHELGSRFPVSFVSVSTKPYHWPVTPATATSKASSGSSSFQLDRPHHPNLLSGLYKSLKFTEHVYTARTMLNNIPIQRVICFALAGNATLGFWLRSRPSRPSRPSRLSRPSRPSRPPPPSRPSRRSRLGRSSVFVSRISWHAGSSGGSRIKKKRSKKHLKKQLHACGGTSNMSSDAKALDIRRSKNTMESTNPNAHQQRGFFLIRQTSNLQPKERNCRWTWDSLVGLW